MTVPFCSVIVASCNRAFLLNRLLQSLCEQNIDPSWFEVIVVDDGSRDGTPLLLQTIKVPFTLRSFRQSNQGPASARNLGVENARAEIIITLDDDVIATPTLLQRHLELFSDNQQVAAMGVMALPSDKRLRPWLEWEAVTLDKQYQAMMRGEYGASPRQFYTANASFRRQDALAAGLFDASFRRAEDVEFAYRLKDLGVRFEFLQDAVVFHEPNRTYKNWLRVPFLYGHYDVVMWQTKGRNHIMEAVKTEFHDRKAILRAAAKLLVGRPRLLKSFVFVSARLATLGYRLGVGRASRNLYSAIFNLQYWQGFCEASGGRSAFWRNMSHNHVITPRQEQAA